MSSSVTRLVCVYQQATSVMAAATAETRPTKSTAVSHAQISLNLRVIGNGSVPMQKKLEGKYSLESTDAGKSEIPAPPQPLPYLMPISPTRFL